MTILAPCTGNSARLFLTEAPLNRDGQPMDQAVKSDPIGTL